MTLQAILALDHPSFGDAVALKRDYLTEEVELEFKALEQIPEHDESDV